ncbi:MAG: DUF4230 domain-containing protein [Gaiellaceae bacterium]
MGVAAPERERASPPRPPHRRPPAGIPWGALIAVAVAVVLLVGVRDWLPGLIPSFPNPFASETVDRSRPAVLQSLRDLSDYRAASGHYEVVVDIERDTPLPAGLLGERTLFVAVGDVDVAVDFSGLGSDAVEVSGASEATVVLPEPRVDRPRLDLEQSYVYDRRRGVFNEISSLFSDDSDAQREVYLAAQRRLAEAAEQNDALRERARVNTRTMLESLLRALGFDTVTVRFE